jgi:DNA-binding transcriptional ArsR family regulator
MERSNHTREEQLAAIRADEVRVRLLELAARSRFGILRIPVARPVFGKSAEALKHDLRALKEVGLLRAFKIRTNRPGQPPKGYAITKQGWRLLAEGAAINGSAEGEKPQGVVGFAVLGEVEEESRSQLTDAGMDAEMVVELMTRLPEETTRRRAFKVIAVEDSE